MIRGTIAPGGVRGLLPFTAVVFFSSLSPEIPAASPAAAIPATRVPGAGDAAGRAESYYFYCLFQQSMMKRDAATAMKYLEAASSADPSSAALSLELARAYLGFGELDRALRHATRAASSDPGSADIRRTLVDVHEALLARDGGDEEMFGRAVAAYLSLIEADPADGEARRSLARLYLSRDLPAQAAEILKPLMAGDPSSVETVFLLSQALQRSGSPAEAESILRKAVEAHPEDLDLRKTLADSLEAGGDLESASRMLADLVRASPDRLGYRFAHARVLARMKRFGEAADLAETLIGSLSQRGAGERPDQARAVWMLYIEAAAADGRMEAALAATLKAEKDFPDETRFSFKRAELLLLAGRDGEADAVFAAARAGKEGTESSRGRISEILLRAGSQAERKGDAARAIHLLRRAIQEDSSNHVAMNYLGYLLADRGDDLTDALALLTRALAEDPGNGAYLDSLGWVLFRLGRLAEAEEPLRRAASLIAEEPVVRDHLGDLLWALGRRDEAVESWSEALRLGAEKAGEIKKKIEQAGSSSLP